MEQECYICHKKEVEIAYIDRSLCGACWTKWSDKPVEALRKRLGLQVLVAVSSDQPIVGQK